MDYFIISKCQEDLASTISKIFEDTKNVKVIADRRKNKNENYSGYERRKFNKIEKIS
tara:strand:+ start:861 stop:1031 length:171 start_codon:yes stop_codon:yes gene_type:complete